eukprot:6492336-Amphidinium_carterae.2
MLFAKSCSHPSPEQVQRASSCAARRCQSRPCYCDSAPVWPIRIYNEAPARAMIDNDQEMNC